MKKIYSFLTMMAIMQTAFNQVVLNEIYPEPGAGRHEFFELYNSGTEFSGSSVDGYTIISYFENGPTRGFYVLDLPDLNIQPKGYLVGSAAIPFNYQGVTNSTASDFSWNDPALTSNHGSLTRWVLATDNDATDGNLNYNITTVPANLNDLFYHMGGSGAAYNAMIFRNGVLVNAFLGNQNSYFLPPAIYTMPLLNISLVRNGQSALWFPVDFNAMQNRPMERVISSIGSDNGYVRMNDGLCGTWEKSSAGVQHTPKQTNGSGSSIVGEINIAATITRGGATATQSTLTYNIVTATGNVFPIDIQFYIDNGSIDGELDATDTYYETRSIASMTNNQFTSMFSPKEEDVLMVIRTNMGCFDHIKFVENILHIVLPVSITSFNGEKVLDKNLVKWSIEGNELVEEMMLEKLQGNTFVNITTVNGTRKSGTQEYTFTDAATNGGSKYRLKLIHSNGQMSYSNIIEIAGQSQHAFSAKLTGNPVRDKFNVQLIVADQMHPVSIRLVDQFGRLIYQSENKFETGLHNIQIESGASLSKGMYMVEIFQAGKHQSLKALKL